MRTSIRLSAAALAVAFAVAACTGGATPSPSPSPSPAAASPSPSEAMASPSPSPDPCANANLQTVASGTLTVGTDNPAYPPYFAENADGSTTDPWELGQPMNGMGFESAVAYAIADKLGFTKDQVKWIVVPFANSYAPGPKNFDFDINQVSYTAERAQAVDMSDGYYFVNQAVVAVAGTSIASVTTISGLKDFQFGAQAGTTSYQTIIDTIAPSKEPRVYDSNDAAITALNNKQIDGLVVDLPTAFYVTAAQMDNGVIVGQFPSPGGADAEHFSLVLAKDSSLTPCVNAAIAALKSDGTLDSITKEWLSDKASAPVFQP